MSELIQKKIRQYLVHSFIYYQLDESIILDKQYDKICKEVFYLMKNKSQSNRLPYQEILKKSLSQEASAFSVKEYPAEIISSALHLLYQQSESKSMSFKNFLTRYGYSLT